MASGNGNGKGNGRKNGKNGAKDSQGETRRAKTAVKRAAFLEAFKNSGLIRVAADVAGIGRGSHYVWLRDVPEYPEQFETAKAEAIEFFEAEARLRATVGSERLVFYKGEPVTIPCNEDDAGSFPDPERVGHFRRFYFEYTKSDILLMFVLKELKPSFRERYEIPAPESHETSWMDLSRDEATIRRAMEAIDRLPLDDAAKQQLRDSITVDE